MKPVDVNPSMYIGFNKENNKEGPKFEIGDNVKKSKFKNIFAKSYVPNWSGELTVSSYHVTYAFQSESTLQISTHNTPYR